MSELKSLLAELTSGDELRAEAAAVQFATLGKPGLYVLARRHDAVERLRFRKRAYQL